MKKLLTMALMALICTMSFAQTKVTGKVTATDGTPVPFASVVVKGTMNGVASSEKGTYVLDKVPANGKLIFSCIGYLDQEVDVAGRSQIDVILATDTETLDETIVVAFGTVNKKDFTGSASTVGAEKIESRPLSNVTNALEGASAGVQFTSASGQPGSAGSIRIRGFGSVNASSSPLYVVDGTPFDSIGNLNPDDIESITILKDAASSALYGSRAANGVVLVTTKKGRSEKLSFDVKINQGISVKAIPEYETLDAYQYIPVAWEALRNSYLSASGSTYTNATASAEAAAKIMGQLANNPFNVADDQVISADGVLNPNATLLYADDLNWIDAVSRVGHRQEYTVSASGANQKSDYYMSIGYLNEQGYTIKSFLERVNGRVNMNVQPRKWLKAGLNLAGTLGKSNVTNTDSSSGYVNPFYFARNIGPIYSIYQHEADGSYSLDEQGEKIYEWTKRGPGASLGRHIVAETLWNDQDYTRNVLNSRAYADIMFLDGFKFSFNASYDFRNYYNKSSENPQVGDGSPAGRGKAVNYRYDTYNFNQLLTYAKAVNGHNFDALLGHESYQNNYNYFYGFKQGVVSDGNKELINYTTTNSCYSYSQQYATEGYMARANYNYNHKYYLSASFRRDGSSRFYKDARWGNFWSVGASWRIDQEAFMQPVDFVDMLKLRASYGSVGNDGTDSWYAWQSLYSILRNANTPGFVQDTQAGNKSLQWEKNKSLDIAVEFDLFKSRLSGSVEFFHRISDNLLFSVPQPLSTGVTSQWQNAGTMFNRGFEFQLSGDIIATRDFNWNSTLNVSTVHNEITKLPEGQGQIISGTKQLQRGHSIYDFWLYEYAGVDPSTGDPLFYKGGWQLDENGDVATDEYGCKIFDPSMERETVTDYTKADKYYVGSAIPKFYGSWANAFTYKNLELSVLLTYSVGGLKYDSTYASFMSVGSLGSAFHKDLLNSWHQAGDETDIPRIDMGRNNYMNPGSSSRWLTSSSYLNVRNITLSYAFPKTIAQKLDLAGLRVYGSVENAYLFCARKGMDPQYNFGGTSYNDYSPAKTASIGINVQF